MDGMDQRILLAMEDGIPLTAEPFKEIAESLGIKEDELLLRLKELKERRIIRRFGASIRHRKVGLTANAMIAWKVPENRVREVGEFLSRLQEVTHCYERKTVPGRWEFNLFIVVHDYERGTIEQWTKKLSETIGIDEYLILFSTREFKKASVPAVTMALAETSDRHRTDNSTNSERGGS